MAMKLKIDGKPGRETQALADQLREVFPEAQVEVGEVRACPECDHFACICAIRAEHDEKCRFRVAACCMAGTCAPSATAARAGSRDRCHGLTASRPGVGGFTSTSTRRGRRRAAVVRDPASGSRRRYFRSLRMLLSCGCVHDEVTDRYTLRESTVGVLMGYCVRRGIWCFKHGGLSQPERFLGVVRGQEAPRATPRSRKAVHDE